MSGTFNIPLAVDGDESFPLAVDDGDALQMEVDTPFRGGGGGGAVNSVNGKTGNVVLDAADVGALPDTTVIPSKTSDLTNDSGFVNASGAASAAPVQSVNGNTGAVVLDAADVGALPDDTTAADLGAYVKPSGGIPASDLASAVQTSLGKADSALQSVPSTYRTAAAQDTIDAGKADKVTEVTISTSGAVSQALDAGKIYHFTGAVSSLSLTLNAASGQIAQYHFDFESGSTPATVTITGVSWSGGSFAPEANKHYEVDILNGYGVYLSW